MNPLETLPIMALRRELSSVCKKMIKIARKPGGTPGLMNYDDQDPEYLRLAKTRDYLCEALRKEWKRQSTNSSITK